MFKFELNEKDIQLELYKSGNYEFVVENVQGIDCRISINGKSIHIPEYSTRSLTYEQFVSEPALTMMYRDIIALKEIRPIKK